MFPVHTAGHSTLGFVTKHSSTTLRDKQSRIYVDKPPLLLYFLTELRHVQPPNTGGDSSLVNQISVNKRASKRKRTHRENLSKARYGCYGHWDVWRWTIVEILSAFRWRMSYHNGYSEKEVSFVNCFFFVAGSRCPWHLIAVFTASSWRSDCWLILSSKLLYLLASRRTSSLPLCFFQSLHRGVACRLTRHVLVYLNSVWDLKAPVLRVLSQLRRFPQNYVSLASPDESDNDTSFLIRISRLHTVADMNVAIGASLANNVAPFP